MTFKEQTAGLKLVFNNLNEYFAFCVYCGFRLKKLNDYFRVTFEPSIVF
jgi:hypothetical protein